MNSAAANRSSLSRGPLFEADELRTADEWPENKLQMQQCCRYNTSRQENCQRSCMAIVKQWEAFPIGPKGDSGDMHVTMGRKGDILIGARAYEKLGQPEAAILLIDRVNQLIGLRPTNVHSGNTYPFQPKPGSKHRIIRANRFCRHYGIRTDHLIAFINPFIDRDGTLVLDLRATRRIGKSADLGKCS